MSTIRKIATCMMLAVLASALSASAEDLWPVPVKDFVQVQPGEHPRLFFRRSDLPELRKRAQTPEGRMLVERTIFLLDGAEKVREGKRYTMFDAAAFGFLYQITGEKKYAQLAARSQDRFWTDGVVDRDDRYSLVPPNEPMRAGPSLYAVALAYDLAYDGWDPDYRKEQAQRILNWKGRCKKRGGEVSLSRLSLNPDNPNPVSNHFGLQVGGAGLTILALRGDPELSQEQQADLAKFQEGVDRNARKVMTEDFGESGYFAEHAGPGVIASSWTFIPWLKAQKVAAGRDWLSNPQHRAPEWMSLRFIMELLPSEKGPVYTNPAPMGGYGTEHLEQDGGSHAGYWSQGFGAIEPKYAPAMLWAYSHFVRPTEATNYKDQLPDGQLSFDTYTYPHRPLYALVNWPFGMKEVNPETVLPKVVSDTHFGRFVFRNRWQDENDTIVAVLFGARTSDKNVKRLMVWSLGQRLEFGSVSSVVKGGGKIGLAVIDDFKGFADGSGSVSAGGTTIGIDFSKASGADAVVVMVGPAATGRITGNSDKTKSRVQTVELGGNTFSILTLSPTGVHPNANVHGEIITLGDQTLTLAEKRIVFKVASTAR